MILSPTYVIDKITDISIDMLRKINICGLILDIDDTLVAPDSNNISEEIINWLNSLKKEKIKIIFVSNNTEERVKKFTENLNKFDIDIPWISMSCKPLGFKIKQAIKKISCDFNNIILVGDQIFTDILAANLLHIKSILVNPVSKPSNLVMKFKRKLENKIRTRKK